MAKSEGVKNEIASLRRKLRSEDSCAENNLAVIYRKLGNRTRAFYWWKRSAETWDDGDSYLEVGYCYQYGIGVHSNTNSAIQSYFRAIKSTHVTDYGCEEASYHLAIVLLDSGDDPSSLKKALKLLKEAAADEDYPQAKP